LVVELARNPTPIHFLNAPCPRLNLGTDTCAATRTKRAINGLCVSSLATQRNDPSALDPRSSRAIDDGSVAE
jgi:hypothetical protein